MSDKSDGTFRVTNTLSDESFLQQKILSKPKFFVYFSCFVTLKRCRNPTADAHL